MPTTDLVVVIPGIMGSALADRDGDEIWGGGGALSAITSLGGSITKLRLPAQFGDDEAPDGVRATRLLDSFHVLPGVWTPVVGYDALRRFLLGSGLGLTATAADGSPPGNCLFFPYDWRLSNRRSGQQLKVAVERALGRWRESDPSRRDAKVTFVCHSMGGLVASWYVTQLGGAEVTRALITLGTPFRGACNALDQLVNGVRKGIGPFKKDLTGLVRSFPSVHQLLPEYACIDHRGTLAKTTEVELPHLDPTMVRDGMAFHDEIDRVRAAATTPGYVVVPVVGTRQPTWTTATIEDEKVRVMRTIGGDDLQGDGTVPRLASRPKGMPERDAVLRAVADGHGNLIANQAVFDQLELLLGASDVEYRAGPQVDDTVEAPSVGIEDLYDTAETVAVELTHDLYADVELVVRDEARAVVEVREVRLSPMAGGGGFTTTAAIDGLATGGYTLTARAVDEGERLVGVTHTFCVLPTS